MKVLHLISGGDTGGAKTHIIALIKSLNKLIDAKIICFIEDTFYHEAKANNIHIEVFEQKNRADLAVINRLGEEIKKEGYDIVHCHGARANFIGMFLKNKIKIPLITTMHSDYELDFRDNFYKRLVFTNLNKLALKKFDYYIAISDTFKNMLISRGFNGDEIFTVYNGIDLEMEMDYIGKEEFLRTRGIDYQGETLVGIIARLDKVKDHETFLRAAKILIDDGEEVKFLIAGEGNDQKRLKELTKELGIEDKVHFIGFIDDPFSFYNAIDINTLTSLSESFPYAVLEGALMKKMIISTNVGGLKELIVDGETGYLIDVGDYKDLARRIKMLLENREKIKDMGENIYNKVRNEFSSDSMAREHVKIYNQIIKKEKSEI